MGMLRRKNRIAMATGTLVAGTLAVTWKDPDTIDGTQVTIELAYDPSFFWVQRAGAYGGAGGIAANAGDLTMSAVTKNGCTVTSANAADTGGFRVFAVCRQEDL
jgi:hypothetical protein